MYRYHTQNAGARAGLKTLLAAFAVGLMAGGSGGCGRASPTSASPSTSAAQAGSANAGRSDSLQLALLNLQSGEIARSIRRDEEHEPELESSLSEASETIEGGPASQSTYFENYDPSIDAEVSAALIDPCEAPSVAKNETNELVWRNALSVFGACLRTSMEPVELARGALVYQIAFTTSLTEQPLSKMTDAELKAFLKENAVAPGMLVGLSDAMASQRLRLRDRFDDRELDELTRLAQNLTKRLHVAETRFFNATDRHRALVEHFAHQSNRYQLLLLLRDSVRRGWSNPYLASSVVSLLSAGGLQVPKSLATFPISMLHPWGIVALSPDEGREMDNLQAAENPFLIIQRAVAQFGGSPERVALQRDLYTKLRDSDNPPMPEHDAPNVDAVHIAVVDTGVDFIKYPALGEFLSNGKNGAMSSYDFQDDDANPYLPSDGADAHGTGTAASVLTVISQYDPNILKERKVDLAVWKLNTIRDQLATPYKGIVNWQSREAMPEALIREATDPTIAVKPKIVSISAIFQLEPFLAHSGHPDAVLKAPWLWIMAAGNEGVVADQDKVPVCLGDVPAAQRNDARILCVGAIRHDILGDKITGYSNFGDRVQLYAYESYSDLCSGGTSCSTPAIAGAAAAVAAKYPGFTPEEIKEVLLMASKPKLLDVDVTTMPSPGLQLIENPAGPHRMTSFHPFTELQIDSTTLAPSLNAPKVKAQAPQRTVNVLDPFTMMADVMKTADDLAVAKLGLSR